MAYIDFSDYLWIYSDSEITPGEFSRYAWEASRLIDIQTTGVDGVKKPTPTDEDDLECVKRCCAANPRAGLQRRSDRRDREVQVFFRCREESCHGGDPEERPDHERGPHSWAR